MKLGVFGNPMLQIAQSIWISCVAIFLGGLMGCASGGGGPATPALNNGLSLGIDRDFDPLLVAQRTADPEYKNISEFGLSGFSEPESSTHPFAFSQVYSAYGYQLSGLGQTIAIFDTGFNSNSAFNKEDGQSAFIDLQRKFDSGLVQIEGSLTEQRGTRSQGHGNYVASIAAAPYDDDLREDFNPSYPVEGGGATLVFRHGLAGVAPSAKLLLSDYNHGLFLGPEGWARATDRARLAGAVAQNNSWALCDPSTDCESGNADLVRFALLNERFPTYPGSANPEQALQWVVTQAGSGNTAQWSAYIQSLKRFQSSGVVVFSLQNRSQDTSPSLVAALPELFPDLKGAWLTVGNMDSNYEVKSAACGATRAYCLMADGHEIAGAGSLDQFYLRASGASVAAPQVSGMIALLAEAFPNLSASQLTSRLLASADNQFQGFISSGSTDFGGGVHHAFSDTHGHGVPNMEAALQPITSRSVPQSFAVIDQASGGRYAMPISQSQLHPSIAFGDAFRQGLAGISTLSFDALGGGFQTPLSPSVQHSNSGLSLRSDGLHKSYRANADPGLRGGGIYRSLNPGARIRLSSEVSVFFNESPREARDQILEDHKGWSRPSYFFMGFDAYDRALPFVDEQQSIGMHVGLAGGLSSHVFTRQEASNSGLPTYQRQSVVTGMSLAGAVPFSNAGLRGDWMLGVQTEARGFRNSQSFGAMRVGPHTASAFFAPRLTWMSDPKTSLVFAASLGLSKTQSTQGSLIQAMTPYVTSGFYGELRRQNWLREKDFGFLRVWQPERAESGTATVGLVGFNSDYTDLVVNQRELALTPSGREMNLSMGYQMGKPEVASWGVLINQAWQKGHRRESGSEQSVTFTMHRLF